MLFAQADTMHRRPVSEIYEAETRTPGASPTNGGRTMRRTYPKVTTAEAYERAGEDRPRCRDHDVAMFWNADARTPAGGQWRCSVKKNAASLELVRAWKLANPEANEAARIASLVKQLERGERIASYSSHHKAMAALKAKLDDPRPDGLELSLAEPLSPTAYLGVQTRGRGRGHALYVLDTDPTNYVYETRADNIARGNPTTDPAIIAELVRRGSVTPQAAAILEERAVA